MTDTALTRREFSRQALGSLLAFSLVESLATCDLFADEVKPLTVKWLADVNELGAAVKGRTLTQQEWQAQIEKLYKQVDLADLLRLIDFDKLTANLQLVDEGARSLQFKFRELEGVPKKPVFGKQIFALKKGRSVVPHGHNNMATAFLILKGDFQGRHYDRLETAEDHFIIRPTIDRKFTAGECSTVSDFKDNIHWFTALDEPAFIFNIHVLGVNPDNKDATGRLYVDPHGEKLSDNRIKARRIEYDEANKKFG